jgi:alpha-L-arabinofuranosidase
MPTASPPARRRSAKDSKGNDWKTVGFWAGLRAATPLAADDGYNHLRIGHPDPLGIMLWTIGQDPSNNGFYGQDRTAGSDADDSGKYGEPGSPEPDLHAGKPNNSKDWGRFENNAKMGPQAYGAAVVDYAKAMKAVDPTVLVGAYVVQPPISGGAHPYGSKWNEGVSENCLRQHGLQRSGHVVRPWRRAGLDRLGRRG